MRMSGLVASWSNCASSVSPPTTTAIRSVRYLLSSLANLNVCMASSRDGDSTTPLTPVWAIV